MHKILAISTLAVAGIVAAPQAHAVVDSDFGIKAGMVSLENDSSPAKNVGLVWNVEFAHMIGMELEANTTVSDGSYDLIQSPNLSSKVDYEDRQLGAYATLTTPGPVYFKAKAGYVNNKFKVGDQDEDETNPAYGVGIGFTAVEIELTRSKWHDQNVDMLSAAFKF